MRFDTTPDIYHLGKKMFCYTARSIDIDSLMFELGLVLRLH
jgi:hypothetical protein